MENKITLKLSKNQTKILYHAIEQVLKTCYMDPKQDAVLAVVLEQIATQL